MIILAKLKGQLQDKKEQRSPSVFLFTQQLALMARC